MKKQLLLFGLLLAVVHAGAVAQSRPGARKPGLAPTPRAKSPAAAPGAKGAVKPPPVYAPIITQRTTDNENAPPPMMVGKVKIKKPVLVYYEEPVPGKSVQQLIMAEENLGLLKILSLEELMARSEVFVDGLGNLALPGGDDKKYRLLGTSVVAETHRRPVGDGRSFYSRLKLPSPGLLYVVRESAEEYRHFVKGAQKKGSFLDFQSNGLPGVDSVRAVYTARKMDTAERGAGSGETIR